MSALNSICPLPEDGVRKSEWSSTWLPRQAAETWSTGFKLWPYREYPLHELYKQAMIRALISGSSSEVFLVDSHVRGLPAVCSV